MVGVITKAHFHLLCVYSQACAKVGEKAVISAMSESKGVSGIVSPTELKKIYKVMQQMQSRLDSLKRFLLDNVRGSKAVHFVEDAYKAMRVYKREVEGEKWGVVFAMSVENEVHLSEKYVVSERWMRVADAIILLNRRHQFIEYALQEKQIELKYLRKCIVRAYKFVALMVKSSDPLCVVESSKHRCCEVWGCRVINLRHNWCICIKRLLCHALQRLW